MGSETSLIGDSKSWRNRPDSLLPYLLCTALLALPLSIALCNIVLGVSLILALITGIWWRGIKELYETTPTFAKVLTLYLSLIPIGLLWTPDVDRGLVILSKQWSWLLLPLILIVFEQKVWRDRLLIFLSIGLGLHLLLSISQAFGIPLPVKAPGGSGVGDPAGLIGHISFGLLYGVWTAWLIQWGLQRNDKWRYIAWVFSAISIVMVFMVQGRSGYLVTVAVLALMVWKLWLNRANWKTLVLTAIIFTCAIIMLALGPAKERTEWTINSIQALYYGDFKNAEARWSLWYTAWEGWKQHPFIGVGSGGYPSTAEKVLRSNTNLQFGNNLLPPSHPDYSLTPAHPHQMYLLDLVRWGPVGLLLLLTLLWQWFRLGSGSDWRENHTDSLISMMALALAVHGLSAPSLEEYHSSMYATILLGLGLAGIKPNQKKKPCEAFLQD